MSTEKDNGGPSEQEQNEFFAAISEESKLRDEFAGKALQGFCANPSVFAANQMNGWALVNCTNEDLADYAYVLARLMLEARKK